MSSTTCNTDWGPTPDDPRPIQSRAAGPATTSRPRDVFLRRILAAHPTKFGHILENAEQYRFQVLLSVPSEGEDCRTDFKRHDFRADAEYFYPASSIKICAAIAALQKLQRMRRKLPGVSVDCATPLAFLPLSTEQRKEERDSSNLDGSVITIGHEIRKLFLVSDNGAFNRLYGFVGQRALNQDMWYLGLSSLIIRHRLSSPMLDRDNRMCPPLELRAGCGGPFCLPPKRCHLALPSSRHLAGIRVGCAYIEEDGTRVEGPMDFSQKNVVSLHHLQTLLTSLFHPTPQHISGHKSDLDLEGCYEVLLREAMVQYPQQSRNPQYRKKEYPDDYCKFFLPGLCRVRPKGALRIFNKIGQAYGFTIENAYIVDIETGRDFYLSTVLYTNANGVLNDDRYEYDTAFRVNADLAEVVARAVWQIPPDQSLNATCLDGIPSAFWDSILEKSGGGGGRKETPKMITNSVQPFTCGALGGNVEKSKSGDGGEDEELSKSVKDMNIVPALALDEYDDTSQNVTGWEWTLPLNATKKKIEDSFVYDPMPANCGRDHESKDGILHDDEALEGGESVISTNVEIEHTDKIDVGNTLVDAYEIREEEGLEEMQELVGLPCQSLLPFYRYFVDE